MALHDTTQWLKWFCEAGGRSSPDEARLEQTPYPFQPH